MFNIHRKALSEADFIGRVFGKHLLHVDYGNEGSIYNREKKSFTLENDITGGYIIPDIGV